MILKENLKNEKSIAENILEILKKNTSTVRELSEKLDISENIIRTTINRMKENKLIYETGLFRDRYKVYSIKEKDEREQIEREFIESLQNAIFNRSKRQTIFKKYEFVPEAIVLEKNEIKAGFLVESLIQTAKQELLNDKDFIEDLKKKLKKLES